MHAENLNFSEAGVREMYNKVVSMLLNVLEFYKLYAPTPPNLPSIRGGIWHLILPKILNDP